VNFLLIKINPFTLVSIRLYVEIANPLKDIVHRNMKCFPLSRRDKSSLVKSTVCDGSEEKGSHSVGIYREDRSKGVFDYQPT
jgi:hypothetical protein